MTAASRPASTGIGRIILALIVCAFAFLFALASLITDMPTVQLAAPAVPNGHAVEKHEGEALSPETIFKRRDDKDFCLEVKYTNGEQFVYTYAYSDTPLRGLIFALSGAMETTITSFGANKEYVVRMLERDGYRPLISRIGRCPATAQ